MLFLIDRKPKILTYMPDRPKDPPTYEDLVRELGYDKMAFFSDMVRPDQHEEREEDANLPERSDLAGLTREETEPDRATGMGPRS